MGSTRRTASWIVLALLGATVLVVSLISAQLAYRGDFNVGDVSIVEVAGERRRGGDDRVRELQSEIVGFEVHGRPPQALSQLGRNRLPSRAARSS